MQSVRFVEERRTRSGAMNRPVLPRHQRGSRAVTVLHLNGRLVLEDGDAVFRDAVNELAARNRIHLVVDLAEVTAHRQRRHRRADRPLPEPAPPRRRHEAREPHRAQPSRDDHHAAARRLRLFRLDRRGRRRASRISESLVRESRRDLRIRSNGEPEAIGDQRIRALRVLRAPASEIRELRGPATRGDHPRRSGRHCRPVSDDALQQLLVGDARRARRTPRSPRRSRAADSGWPRSRRPCRSSSMRRSMRA